MPVKSDDHIAYIAKAFPEFFILEDPSLTLERDWAGDLMGQMNIYNGPRASHDRKCLSTRVRPIGRYPLRTPMNFKKFKPPRDWLSEVADSVGLEEPNVQQHETNMKLPLINNPYNVVSPNVCGFSRLHKKNFKREKEKRASGVP